ncbi:MAG: hypothetical protein LBJ14_04495 [Desulfarculales bacterium]|jgi:propionate CoA-transferase|nr:hypothetical protein [Desulfarculales bacterium]
MPPKIITPQQAALLVQDEDTLAVSGFMANLVPFSFIHALADRYRDSGRPHDLTYIFSSGQTTRAAQNPLGFDKLAQEGLLKRTVGSHYAVNPAIGRMAIDEKIEAFNLPMGIMAHLYRDMAGGKPGTISHVGLKTYIDPRLEGGKLNQKARDSGYDAVELITINGQEQLFYKAIPINICVIRGSYADEKGNISFAKEGTFLEATAMAQATRRFGGKVAVQVECILQNGSLHPKDVKIPHIYVDYIIPVGPENMPEYDSYLSPAIAGDTRVPGKAIPAIPLNERKIIARRAAMELSPDSVVNLGVGIPEAVAMVANEEGIAGYITLTVEAGPVGGISSGGSLFGTAVNPDAILTQGQQFDFYDGAGLDLAYLGSGEVDEEGNVNVSDLGTFLTGCGGFINISQNAKKLFFCGSFTAKGLQIQTGQGKLSIIKEGAQKKFIKKVRQITFSGEYARNIGQPILFITERAVFKLQKDGLHLIEIAPGVDIKNDVLAHMDFMPKIPAPPQLMDSRIFTDKVMNIKNG